MLEYIDCFCTKRFIFSLVHAVVDCLALPLLTDGIIDVNTTTFNSTAAYSCNDGYQLVGDTGRVCLSSGWSGVDPVCNCECLSTNNLEQSSFLHCDSKKYWKTEVTSF